MHDARRMTRDVRGAMRDARCARLTRDARYAMHDARRMTRDVRGAMCEARCAMRDA
jgi:hypothetical protein